VNKFFKLKFILKQIFQSVNKFVQFHDFFAGEANTGHERVTMG